MLIGSGLWDGRKHYLDKMTLSDLVKAYAAYPAIQAYAALAVIAAGLVVAWWPASPAGLAAAVAATVAGYPVIWYLLHRYVLHGRYLYKWAATAAVWKRIHYDHHQDPNDLGVLFGALYTTLPTIAAVTLPVGWLLAGPAGSAAAFGTGMVVTCFYEYCHCIQHLAYTPRSGFLRRIKKLHLLHHFHSEKGNFGITSFAFDKVLGTFYGDAAAMARSDTLSNLGYAGDDRARYPWVMNLSAGDSVDGS